MTYCHAQGGKIDEKPVQHIGIVVLDNNDTYGSKSSGYL
jgi:hypothetical protein